MRTNRTGLAGPGILAFIAIAAVAGLPLTAAAQLATGLAGASGSTIGPDGAIYVTEGAAGRLTRVDTVTGAKTTIASDLPTAIAPIGGPIDVAFLDGEAYVLVTLVGDPAVGAQGIDGIYRIDGPSSYTIIADIGSWSAANPPAPVFQVDLVNGVQYAIQAWRGGFLVTDGHLNRILRVSLDGEISEFASFGNIVPTGLETQGRTVLMAEMGPSPHYPEDGKIIAIDAKTGRSKLVASGMSMLVDVEFGPGGDLYALAQGVFGGGDPGSPAAPYSGSLLRVRDDGSFKVLATSLNLPTSLEIVGNTAYVVNLAGEVWAYPQIAHHHGRSKWFDDRDDDDDRGHGHGHGHGHDRDDDHRSRFSHDDLRQAWNQGHDVIVKLLKRLGW